jgi:predicted CXXCH cytochrome family protein
VTSHNSSRTTGIVIAVTSIAIVVSGISAVGLRPAPRVSDVVSPPFVLSPSSTFSSQRCEECHADVVARHTISPHSRTLTRATGPAAISAFAGKEYVRNDTGIRYHYFTENDQLKVSSSAYDRSLAIDWIFGSGTHAQTPLILVPGVSDETMAIEHSVSAYPNGHLGLTLGMDAVQETTGAIVMGNLRPHGEATNCFGCHCSHVPVVDQQIQFQSLQPGIGCNRCHADLDRHTEEVAAEVALSIERFADLQPLESVNRCGECHRRADEMGAPIDPDDTMLPRFASVGLVQSPCFLNQASVTTHDDASRRLDCTSCHDPHQATDRDWRSHARICLSCHDSSATNGQDCSKASRSDNCLSCHMPKVPAGPHLSFTDHWIRIRKTDAPE